MTEAVVRAVNIALLCFAGVEAVIMACSFRRDMRKKLSQKLFFSKILVASFGMLCFAGCCMRGPELRDPLNVILLSLSYTGLYVVYYLYITYLRAQIAEFDKDNAIPSAVSYVSLVICVVGSTLWSISAVDSDFEEYNLALMKNGIPFEVGHICGMILIIITIGILIRRYRTLGIRRTLILGSMPALMAAATFIEPHAGGIELHYPAIMLEFIIVYTQHHLNLERRLERDEVADQKAKLALATGRMKPHYIYNVLTTIYYLCETDPEKAQRAVGTFSEYLRNTLEVMERQTLVSFSRELAEIRHYLELEKLRFGDRLKVDYDVEYDEFLVPPLSIQPLVENAVKHGIAAKEEGGTVRIVSRKLSGGGAQIRILDDGVGFDVDELKDLDVTHEGLANVKERLRLEVGGDLTITSVPGRMTTVVVTIRPPEAGAARSEGKEKTVRL